MGTNELKIQAIVDSGRKSPIRKSVARLRGLFVFVHFVHRLTPVATRFHSLRELMISKNQTI
jgi:UDP:flavonoid glycosyltransferase YjiC (YdhE family)